MLLHPDLRAVNERLSFVRILLDLVVMKSELRSWDEMLGCQPWSITSRIVIELEGGNGGGHVSSAPPRTPPMGPTHTVHHSGQAPPERGRRLGRGNCTADLFLGESLRATGCCVRLRSCRLDEYCSHEGVWM